MTKTTYYKDRIPVVFLFQLPRIEDGMAYYEFPDGSLTVSIWNWERIGEMLFPVVQDNSEPEIISIYRQKELRGAFAFIVSEIYAQGKKQLLNPRQSVTFNGRPFDCFLEESNVHFESATDWEDSVMTDLSFRLDPEQYENCYSH